LTMTAGRKKIELGPGESYTVEPGTAHKFENKGDVDVCFRCEVRPALSFEALIETMYGLAADGKTNKKGHAEPAPPRGDREAPLRPRPAAGRPARAAKGRACNGRADRPEPRL